jgi:diadenosine tetraphosphatase ApaH/serine/threonine PP2A family protein phosphatase
VCVLCIVHHSVSFGYAAAAAFLEKNNLLCIIRAHAVQEGGYHRHFEDALRRHDSLDATAAGISSNSSGTEGGGDSGGSGDAPVEKALVPSRPNSLPAVITVFSAPNYCGRYGNK